MIFFARAIFDAIIIFATSATMSTHIIYDALTILRRIFDAHANFIVRAIFGIKNKAVDNPIDGFVLILLIIFLLSVFIFVHAD